MTYDGTFAKMPNRERPYAKGICHAHSKLSNEDVREIRRLLATTSLFQREIGAMFGVDRKTIGDIKQGLTWTHVLEGE